MAKKIDNTEEKIHRVEEALSRSEQFFEIHQKKIFIVLAVILVVVGGYLGFKKFYLAPKETEAQKQMWAAQRYFAQDSLDLAINGDGNYPGFASIIEDYGMTQSANLAHYYLGICYLKKGQYEKAIENLEKFSGDDQIVGPMATGALGDCNMELGKTDKAAEYYVKAADQNKNNFSTPIFLMKAGWAYEILANYDKAITVYERIQKEHPRSFEANEAEKYIARAKGLSGKK